MKLIRYDQNDERTFGILVVPDSDPWLTLHTLELPWRDNARNVSCIPADRYPVSEGVSGRLNRRYDGHVLRVDRVPGRSLIRIHCGNTADQIEGCVLVGMERGRLGDQEAVLRSGEAYGKLLDLDRGLTDLDILEAW